MVYSREIPPSIDHLFRSLAHGLPEQADYMNAPKIDELVEGVKK